MYYTLLSRIADSQWRIEFGDFKRKVVEDEQRDMKSSGDFVRGTKFTIIKTKPDQPSIDAEVKRLNFIVTVANECRKIKPTTEFPNEYENVLKYLMDCEEAPVTVNDDITETVQNVFDWMGGLHA